MNNSIKNIALSVLVCSIGLTSALQAKDLSYNQLDFSVISYDVDDIDVDATGITVDLNAEISEPLYFALTYDLLDFDVTGTLEQTIFGAGIGAHMSLSNTVDAYGEFQLIKVDLDGGFMSIDDNGHMFEVGLRSMVSDTLEVAGRFKQESAFDDNVNTFEVKGSLFVDEMIAVGGNLLFGDDYTGLGLGLKLNF